MSTLAQQLLPANGEKHTIDDEETDSKPNIIIFKTGDKQCCHEITDKHVKVICSSGKHDHGSSKVKLKNIVDYKWEVKNYPGHLIAVHIDGKHIAYVINVNNKASRMEGMIRVVNAQTGLRALIKGMSGEVLDLQFAHIEKDRILGSIDANSLYVHKIDMVNGTLLCNLILKVEDPLANYTPKYDKISWCPYIEVPSEDDEYSQMVVWARGSIFQCFNVNTIVGEHSIGLIKPKDITTGYLKFQDESLTMSWVTLSPDGSTLGVGSIDGFIRFYQVYMHEAEPRCLHQWRPHNGKSISSFFFLDNLTKNGADTYWKYAITGASNNTEFKVWDCGTWECLQTINMTTHYDEKKTSYFIADIDRTSSYLVLTSLETKNCYILQIVNNNINKQNENNTTTSFAAEGGEGVVKVLPKVYSENSISDGDCDGGGDEDGNGNDSSTKNMPLAYIKSISEFPLSSGILSFSIVDAVVRRYKCGNDNYLLWEELDDYDEETNSIYCVVLRMFIVQSKSMQECRILYQPSVTESTETKTSLFNDSSKELNISRDSSISVDCQIGDNTSSTSNNEELQRINVINDGNEDGDANIVGIKQENQEANEQRSIAAVLGQWPISGSKNNAGASQITLQTTTTTSTSSMVALTAATRSTEGPASPISASIKNESVKSHSTSPQVTASGKAYSPQVNLMTPDAFNSSSSGQKSPERVSSEVLNTILMLASVTGQTVSTAPNSDGVKLLKLVNSIRDEQENEQQIPLKQAHEKKFMVIGSNTSRSAGDNLASGGSSPSREVQEIMSQQEYDKSSPYCGDDELLLNEQETKADSVVAVAEVSESTVDLLDSNTKLQPQSQSVASTPNWPSKLPIGATMGNSSGGSVTSKHSAELQNAVNLISQAVVNSSSHVLCTPPSLVSGVCASGANTGGSNATLHAPSTDNASVDLLDVDSKLKQLIDLVKMQSIQISSLHNEIVEIKKSNLLASQKNMSEFSFKLELQLSKMMEQYLKRYENEHNKQLSAFLLGRDVQNRELLDKFIQIINQCVLKQFSDMVGKIISIEMQRNLAPMLTAKIDHMQQNIQLDVAQKLTAFDHMLKENIAQVCKSKNIIDAFGKSVLVGVQGSLQAAFIESMSSTLIPAYEKSSQHMFKQLHEAFSVGIKEFMEQFNSYVQHLQPMRDSTEEILNVFAGFPQHMDGILSKHRNAVNDMMMETRKDMKNLEMLIARQTQETIRTELRKYHDNQTATLRSQANTPAPMYDMKDAIKLLLSQGQINKAFHQALLANDLNLVEFTLKQVDQNTVFTPTCSLEQKVLLSLIQQISADMSNHNELKQNYLADALLAINPADPISRDHAPKVLQDLFRNCQKFLMNYSKSPQCSSVRMLMKAVQAYQDQF